MLGKPPISIQRIVDSDEEPISLEQAKAHLRVVDFDDDNDYIAAIIRQARHTVEKVVRRALFTGQTWQAGYTELPYGRRLSLPRPPLGEVVSVQYYDSDNVLRTVSSSDYVVDDSGSDRAIVALKSSYSYPSVSDDYPAPWRVTYGAGYADAEAIPADLLRAMYYLIQHFYDNRSPVGINVNLNKMPYTFQFLLDPHVVPHRV